MRIRMSASRLLGGAAVAIGPTPAPAPSDPLRFELSRLSPSHLPAFPMVAVLNICAFHILGCPPASSSSRYPTADTAHRRRGLGYIRGSMLRPLLCQRTS
ncbi:hypothetical protein ZWY2020_034701 [Hordeum vulgare]|nr:hypothetical protein ZWY2020_034701 [Hordeum vulgare]